MKNFFNRFKSYSFWVSLSAALIIFLNAIGRAFGFSIENQIVEDCVMSIAGLLLVLGIVSMGGEEEPKDEDNEDDQNDENNNE